jgi:hypothetical protein
LKEPPGGIVQMLYEMIAVKKTTKGKELMVFWDKKCLNDG